MIDRLPPQAMSGAVLISGHMPPETHEGLPHGQSTLLPRGPPNLLERQVKVCRVPLSIMQSMGQSDNCAWVGTNHLVARHHACSHA